MSEFRLIGPLAYQGKTGCRDVRCTHMFPVAPDGSLGECIGWHCSYCDAPTGSQGHHCDVGDILLTENKRLIDSEDE